jgi:hypothetical protein
MPSPHLTAPPLRVPATLSWKQHLRYVNAILLALFTPVVEPKGREVRQEMPMTPGRPPVSQRIGLLGIGGLRRHQEGRTCLARTGTGGASASGSGQPSGYQVRSRAQEFEAVGELRQRTRQSQLVPRSGSAAALNSVVVVLQGSPASGLTI